MAWQYEITDKNFVSQGEFVDVHDSKVSVQLNKVRTAGLKVRLDNTLAPFVAQQSVLEPIYLKIYRNGKIVFNGPVQSVQEAGDENDNATLAITAAGPEIIWTQRLLRTGMVYCTDAGIKTVAGTSRSKQFREMVASNEAAGAGYRGQMHIDYTSWPINSTNTEAYEAPSYKLLAEILTEMYNQAAGFDWYVYPTEPTGLGPIGKIGTFLVKDTLNTTQPNAVFEWGAGRSNIASFTRNIDMTSLLNLGWNIASAGPNASGAPTVFAFEETPYAETWNIREGMVSLAAQNIPMREQITKETVAVRRVPRQTISMSPVTDVTSGGSKRVPQFEADYYLGDSVKTRIVYEKVTHLEGYSRVWGVDFTVDENGKETQTLTLSDNS